MQNPSPSDYRPALELKRPSERNRPSNSEQANEKQQAPEKKAARPSPEVFARILRLARPEAKLLGWGTLFLAIGSAANLAFPQAMKVVIDEALAARSTAKVNQAALLMAGLFLVQGVAVSVRHFLFALAGERAVNRLRKQLFERVLSQEIGFFDQRRTGELTSRLSSDTTVLQGAVSGNISMVLRNAVLVVGGIALLVYTSPKLTLVMLSVVPPVAFGAVAYGRRVRKLAREVQDALARSGEVADESISGIRTVRSFAAEKAEVARYGAAVTEALALARKRIVAAATFMGGSSFFAYSSAVLVLWYGGRLVMDGSMTVGGLTSFIVYSMFVAFSLGTLSDLWAEFMKAGGASERVFELLDRVPAIPIEGGLRPTQIEGRVEFEKVAFAYPSRSDVQVLSGFELTLAPGEHVALVGPSGAGKSTLAALLVRLYDPQAGRVLLDGVDLRTLDPVWLRQQIGVVSQEPLLFSTNIAENIRYGRPEATDAEVEAAAKAAYAHDFITRFPEGYQTLVGERGVQLSGGQKQRVAIARALLKNPRLIILDEATSALDAESEHLVREALQVLMKGRTTLVIAHRLSTIVGADRVLVVEGGQIVQSGRHSDLLEQGGLYRRLVDRQVMAR